MSNKDKYNIAPGAQVGATGDNAHVEGGEFTQTVFNYGSKETVVENVKKDRDKKSGRTIVITGQTGAVGRGAKSHDNTFNEIVDGEVVKTRKD